MKKDPGLDSTAWIGVLRGGSLLSFARGIVLVLQVAQYFILAKFLAPAGFGQVGLFNIILLYGSLVGFGTDNVAVRETPGRLAANDQEGVEKLRNMALTYELALRIILALLVVAAALVLYDGTLRIGMLLIAPVLILDKAQVILYGLGSAMKRFSVLSRASVITGLLMGGVTLGMLQYAGVYAQLIGMLVTGIVVTAYYWRSLDLKLRLLFDKPAFMRILRMGIPFVGMTLAYYLWKASDRTLIAGLLSKELLGQYTFAAAGVQMIMSFLNDFQTAFLPAIYERTAVAEGIHDVNRIVRKPSLVLAYLTPVIIAAVWIAYKAAVWVLMPEYNDTVWVFRLLTAQVFLVNVAMMAVYVLRSPEINRQICLVWSYIVATGISYVLILAAIRTGFGLEGVAVATLLAQFVAVVMTFGFAQKHYLSGWRMAVSYYAELVAPFLGLGLFFLGIYWIEEKLLLTEVWKTLYGIAAVIVFAAGILAMLDRRVGLFAGVMGLTGLKQKAS